MGKHKQKDKFSPSPDNKAQGISPDSKPVVHQVKQNEAPLSEFLPTEAQIVGAQAFNAQQIRLVKPEQMSLNAYQHIQSYLGSKKVLTKEEITAVLRLSQHLRVFGLLSAAGYLKHSKKGKVQEQTKKGKVQEQTTPVWKCLLGHLIVDVLSTLDETMRESLLSAAKPIDKDHLPDKEQLIQIVKQMADNYPAQYMVAWRKSMMMSNYWNFWAKAYQEEE